ncbi:MAG: DUF4407 domain-containing protein [Chitinophagales bacterium]|nr:DUF4407 domain-containing protein [Bacteroidota bacterium]MCB9043238.1 DUF4407 domain-containing protein [Chitinophagales bacterium]
MQTNKTASESTKISPITRFFWWCSGANIPILETTPSEWNVYFGMGATILTTAILAFFSGSYALFTIFGNVPLAIAFGLLWAMVIFNFDRFIVASLRKNFAEKPDKNASLWQKLNHFFLNNTSYIVIALPRLVLAIFIGIIISKPLELRIFQAEVEVKLLQLQAEKAQEITQANTVFYQDIEKLQAEKQQLQQQLATKEDMRDTLEQAMIAEAEGTAGSGAEGKGPVFWEKRKRIRKIETELTILREQVSPRINQLETQINALETEKLQAQRNAKNQAAAYNGLLARLEALHSLQGAPFSPNWLKINLITFLFMLIEAAPVLVKMFLNKGNYDYKLYKLIQSEKTAFDQKQKMQEQQQQQAMTYRLEQEKAQLEYQAQQQQAQLKFAQQRQKQQQNQANKMDKMLWKELENVRQDKIKRLIQEWEKQTKQKAWSYQELAHFLQENLGDTINLSEQFPENEQIIQAIVPKQKQEEKKESTKTLKAFMPHHREFDLQKYLSEINNAFAAKKIDFVFQQLFPLFEEKTHADIIAYLAYLQSSYTAWQNVEKAQTKPMEEIKAAREDLLEQLRIFLQKIQQPLHACLLVSSQQNTSIFQSLIEKLSTKNIHLRLSQQLDYDLSEDFMLIDLYGQSESTLHIAQGLFQHRVHVFYAQAQAEKLPAFLQNDALAQDVLYYSFENTAEIALELDFKVFQQIRCETLLMNLQQNPPSGASNNI